uniref:Uncharacterized protein n=1 Tax=Nelumbo nucifera TaxID=4432 RepID=A0A822ZSK5_NELNU|nr:TPA_asm: hypothetical protein HUJ06_004549 [Nelumbo nucifera]
MNSKCFMEKLRKKTHNILGNLFHLQSTIYWNQLHMVSVQALCIWARSWTLKPADLLLFFKK